MVWMGHVGDVLVCGVSGGTVAVLDEERREVVRTWSTKKWAFSFGAVRSKGTILSGHDGLVRMWDIEGNEVHFLVIMSALL